MLGKRRRLGTGPPDWLVIEGYNDGYPRTSPVGSFEANFMVCTTWEATYGNGAKIGIMLKRNTVCCAVRRGTISSPAICLLRLADNAPDYRRDFIGFRCVVR